MIAGVYPLADFGYNADPATSGFDEDAPSPVLPFDGLQEARQGLVVVGGDTVLGQIETDVLFLRAHAQTDRGLDGGKQAERGGEYEGEDGANATEFVTVQTSIDQAMVINTTETVAPRALGAIIVGTEDPTGVGDVISNYIRDLPTVCEYTWLGTGLITQTYCP